jgi:cytochrome c biogenesis protein CcmG, thiol:disulfide interchange protein DsbE
MKQVTLIMKIAAVILIVGVLSMLFFYSKQQDANVKSSDRVSVPALGPTEARPKAPAWSGVTDKGDQISLLGLRGRIVHLVFWAQWCAPCQRELPALNAFAKEHAANYTVLLFNLDDNDEDRNAARKMLKELSPDLTAIYQDTRVYADILKVEALPYHVVVDKTGLVAATFISAITDDMPAFRKIIDGL